LKPVQKGAAVDTNDVRDPARSPGERPRFRRGERVAIDWQHSEKTATVYRDGSFETVVVETDQTHALCCNCPATGSAHGDQLEL
jgi:hypothetical protein